jgi:hypothetical protein
MSKQGFWLRGGLYILAAASPVILAGMEAGRDPKIIAMAAFTASVVALRAFIDKSPAEVESSDPSAGA